MTSFPATSMRQSMNSSAWDGQLRRDRVHRVGQPLPVTRQRAAGNHRHHVLRRLQVAVIGEQDQVAGGQVPVGGVQHRDVDHAVLAAR